MLFKENPFYLLSVHSTDGAAAIDAALSHKRMALSKEAEGAPYSKAAHWLLQMEHRSEAEYFWPSGLPRKEAFLLAQSGESDSPLSPRLRLLRFLNALPEGTLTLEALLAAEEDFLALSPQEALEDIQRDRRVAGFPAIEEPWVIEGYQQALMLEIGSGAIAASRILPEEERRGLLIALAKQGRRGMLYTQLLSAYEADVAKGRAQLENDIAYALMISPNHPQQGLSLLAEKTRRYLSLSMPLYAMSGCWVLRPVFSRIRNRAIDLSERLGRETGEQWLALMEDLFAFAPVFAKEIREDQARLSRGEKLLGRKEETERKDRLEIPRHISRIPHVEMEKGDRHWGTVVVIVLALAFLLFGR